MKGYACVHGLARVDLSGVAGVRKAAGPPAPPRDGDVGQGEGLFSSSQLFNATLRRLTLLLYLRVVLHDGSHLCLPCNYCMQKEKKRIRQEASRVIYAPATSFYCRLVF